MNDVYQVTEILELLLEEYYKFAELCETLSYDFKLTTNTNNSYTALPDNKSLYQLGFNAKHRIVSNNDKQTLHNAIYKYIHNVSQTLTDCFKDSSRNYNLEEFDLSSIKFDEVKLFDGFICEGKSELIFKQTQSSKEFEGSFYFRKKLLPNKYGWINLPVEYYKVYILYDILCSLQFYHARGKIFYLYRYLSHPCFEHLPCSFGCPNFESCCNEHRIVPSERHKQVSIEFLNLLISTFVSSEFNIEFFLFHNGSLLESVPYIFKDYRTMERTTYPTNSFSKIASIFYIKLFNFYFSFFWDSFCFVPNGYTLAQVNSNLFFLVKSASNDYYNDYNLVFKYWQRRFIRMCYEPKNGSVGDNFVLYFSNSNYYLKFDDKNFDYLFEYPPDQSDFCLSFINLNRPTAQIYESLRLDMQEMQYPYLQSNTIELEIEDFIPLKNAGRIYAFNILSKIEHKLLIPAKGMRIFNLRTSHSRLNFLYLNLEYIKNGMVIKHENGLIYVINCSNQPKIFEPKRAFNFFTNSIKFYEDYDKFL